MVSRQFFKASIASIALIGALAAAPAAATVITFDLDTVVEGDTPSGFPTLTFDDGGTSGTANLTIDATGLSGDEFIRSVLFNFVDAGTTDLTFTRTGGDGPTTGFTVFQDADGRDSPGNQGLFDIEIEFGTSADDATRFNADELLTFSIVGDDIVATDFNIDSAPEGPNNVTNFALARLQGLADDGSASVADGDGGDGGGGGIPVPEPAALGLFGLGLVAVGLGRRRKRA